MARDPGRNHVRENIAHLAARLMAEDGVEDYAQAKRKAARQIGASDSRQMPNNDEIDAALTLYRKIYRPDHAAELRNIRQLALDIMLELAAFNPYLVGTVLKGSAGKYADIHLQLFSDSMKSVEHYLLDHDIRFRGGETTLYAGDMPLSAPVLSFNRQGYDVHLTLLSSRDLRSHLKTSPAGKPIDRARREAVEALIAGT
jgi:hypothetical protein